MAYYNTCPKCGAYLDPGEKCDCEKNANRITQNYENHIFIQPDGQLTFKLAYRTR